MRHEDLTDRPAIPVTKEQQRHDDEPSQRSGATIVFWILVVFLACLGICVLLSVLLAIVNGS